MKIGIIIHSFTGHTLSVAERVKNTLQAGDHDVTLQKIGLNSDYSPQKRNITIISAPGTAGYDALIFGAPVEGFSLSPVMQRYLEGIDTLEGRKVACLLTQFFPFAWMGGSRAARQLAGICSAKGAEIAGTAIVNWAGADRRARKIADAVAELGGVFG